ncbi:MAG: hypothetical protein ACOC47_02565 [Alkalispirochaetaceae bacterium]
MNQIVPRPESRDTLVETGLRAISGLGGGLALLFLRSLSGFGGLSLPGIVAGGAISLFGLSSAAGSKHPADRRGGLATAAIGALTLGASLPVVGAPISALMWLGGIGLVGYGAVSVARFLRGLRTRK